MAEVRTESWSEATRTKLRREPSDTALSVALHYDHALLDALPTAVYTTDRSGRLTYYNRACLTLSGRTPVLGSDQWCVTWKLYHPDGTPMPHDQCPMAVALREGHIIEGVEAIAERPDGSRVWFTPYPVLLRDDAGTVTGAINMLVDITERKEAEQALVVSKQRLQRVLETEAVAVLFFNYDGMLVNANEVFLRMTGYSRQQIESSQLHWRTMTPPEWVAASQQQMEKFSSTGRIGPYEKEYLLADGTKRWMLFAGRDLGDGTIAEFCVDIEDQKRREADAQILVALGSETVMTEKPQVIYEKVMDAAAALMRSQFASMQIWHSDRGQGGELELLAHRGFDADSTKYWQWVGLNSTCSCGLALRAGNRIVIADAPHSDQLDEDQKQAYQAAGIVSMQSTPLFSRSGILLGMISTHWDQAHEPTTGELDNFDILARQAADIIERGKAEEEIRKNERWLASQKRALQSALNGAPLEESLDHLVRGVIDKFGKDTRAAFYLAASDGETLHHVTGMPTEYAEAIDGFKIGSDSLACGLAVHAGKAVLTPDVTEEPKWVEWRWIAGKFGFRACWSIPLQNSEGKLLGTLAVYWPCPRKASEADAKFSETVADTAAIIIARQAESRERRQAEAALRVANDELERRVQERTQDLMEINEQLQGFTYSVAHDLRQQIRGISANASILTVDAAAKLDEESQAILSRLVGSSKQLGLLVDDLLTYARLGKQNPNLLPIDLSMLTEEVAGHIIDQGICKQGTRFRIAPGMQARGDRSMLRIVMENLLENGAKYSSKGDEPIIEVGMQDGTFFVKDNGVGFDTRFKDRLFQPFERLHRDNDYAGTGIGLANVKRIVEKHGGAVWAESTLGQGATFFFTLP